MRNTLLVAALLGASVGLPAGLNRAGRIGSCILALVVCIIASACVCSAKMYDLLIPAWIAVALGGATIWLPAHHRNPIMLFALSCLSGALTGMLPTASAAVSITLFAVSLTLVAVASTILLAKDWILPARVAASWLVAIAALNVTLTLLRVTPGYLPDHLE